MARERVKRYESAGISKNRYLELKSIARQYDELHEKAAKLKRGELDRAGRLGGDPTGETAIDRTMRDPERKIRAIEEAARSAGADLYPWLMRCVTRGEKHEHMHPPIGRAQFYQLRRLFFLELDKRLP